MYDLQCNQKLAAGCLLRKSATRSSRRRVTALVLLEFQSLDRTHIPQPQQFLLHLPGHRGVGT